MELIKIQKYFTDCGIMSRRAAEIEIQKQVFALQYDDSIDK